MQNRTICRLSQYWKKHKFFVQLVGTVILFAFLFSRISITSIIGNLGKINELILLPLLLYPLGIYLSTLKWDRVMEKKHKFLYLFQLYWISNFFSNFLPSTIGGDSYKLLKLKKYGLEKNFSAIILDRGSGIFSLLILLSISFFPIYTLTKNQYLVLLPFITLIGSAAAFWFFLTLTIRNKRIKKIQQVFKNNSNKLPLLLLLSILFIFLGSISFWIYFYMFGYALNFFNLFFVYILVRLITLIPISVNGWGLKEGSLVYFVGFLGVPPDVAFSIALVARIASLIATSGGGLIYLFRKLSKMTKLFQSGRE